MSDSRGKTYRPWAPQHYRHEAHSPEAKLPEDDLVFFLLDTVPHLALSRFYAPYEDATRGAPPFDPKMMVCLLLYAYCVGVCSSRKIAQACERNLAWFGLRALGRLKHARVGRFYYWLDIAGVAGHETLFDFARTESDARRVAARRESDVMGWGLDVGVSWQTKLPWRPTLTLSYAVGSGDSTPDSGTDRAFRQTGLQDNNNRFRGVNRFRYYGELLDPELSNLQIFTAALGFRVLRSSSIELIFHLYHQVEPADFLRDARLKVDPEGEERAVGQEWNLVLGIEEWQRFEIELIGSMFRAGTAYGDLYGELAYGVSVKVDVNF